MWEGDAPWGTSQPSLFLPVGSIFLGGRFVKAPSPLLGTAAEVRFLGGGVLCPLGLWDHIFQAIADCSIPAASHTDNCWLKLLPQFRYFLPWHFFALHLSGAQETGTPVQPKHSEFLTQGDLKQ